MLGDKLMAKTLVLGTRTQIQIQSHQQSLQVIY